MRKYDKNGNMTYCDECLMDCFDNPLDDEYCSPRKKKIKWKRLKLFTLNFYCHFPERCTMKEGLSFWKMDKTMCREACYHCEAFIKRFGRLSLPEEEDEEEGREN